MKSQQAPPLWNSSWGCQYGDSVRILVFFFFFFTKINVTERDRAHSSGDHFLHSAACFLSFPEKTNDELQRTSPLLPLARGWGASSESQPKWIIFQFNWCGLVCLFFRCFPGALPEIFFPSVFCFIWTFVSKWWRLSEIRIGNKRADHGGSKLGLQKLAYAALKIWKVNLQIKRK